MSESDVYSPTNKPSKKDYEKAVTIFEKKIEELSINAQPPKLVRQTNIGLPVPTPWDSEDIIDKLCLFNTKKKGE